jgi:ribitol-5-phosphate 2-dehydrogenase (NADP+) / D-ribitol-5-phosphate cytidylyltransferase
VEVEGDVALALSETSDRYGRIDCVIVTAGTLQIGPLSEMHPEQVREMINVNYLGVLYVAQLAVGYLQRTRGQLLLFASSSFTRGRSNSSVYSSTKAAVVNLTQALAEEWLELGVRVNCLSPERTATPMRRLAFGDEPASSLLGADEVAGAAIAVISSNITGQVVDVRRSVSTPYG